MNVRHNVDLPSEAVLWKGRPSVRALAKDVFLVDWVLAYFAAIAIWTIISKPSGETDPTLIPYIASLFLLGLVAATLLTLAAFLLSRITRYRITDRHIILRAGLVRDITVSIPLDKIEQVEIFQRPFGTAEFVFRVGPGLKVSPLHLWPNIRRLGRAGPQPSFRCINNHFDLLCCLERAGVACGEGHSAGPVFQTRGFMKRL